MASDSTLFTSVGFEPVVAASSRRSRGPADQPSCGVVANRPCRYGGSQRGIGSLPSITSSSAFSSPNRYSSGPATRLTGASHSRSGVGHLAQRAFERVDLGRERRLHRDERLACADDGRRDRQALEHLVRIRAHQRAVLERARLALGAVRDDVAVAELGAAGDDRSPLASRWGSRRRRGRADPTRSSSSSTHARASVRAAASAAHRRERRTARRIRAGGPGATGAGPCRSATPAGSWWRHRAGRGTIPAWRRSSSRGSSPRSIRDGSSDVELRAASRSASTASRVGAPMHDRRTRRTGASSIPTATSCSIVVSGRIDVILDDGDQEHVGSERVVPVRRRSVHRAQGRVAPGRGARAEPHSCTSRPVRATATGRSDRGRRADDDATLPDARHAVRRRRRRGREIRGQRPRAAARARERGRGRGVPRPLEAAAARGDVRAPADRRARHVLRRVPPELQPVARRRRACGASCSRRASRRRRPICSASTACGIYHDQALFKEPGGGHTPWHQDQFYWPFDTEKTITMWMPLADLDPRVGSMTFATGSHTRGQAARPRDLRRERGRVRAAGARRAAARAHVRRAPRRRRDVPRGLDVAPRRAESDRPACGR